MRVIQRKSLEIGGNNSIFVPMTGAPFLTDLENNRRMPTLDDLANFHKLSHMLPAIHSSAHHIVEPMDHAISHRHLRITYSSMKHSDKTFMGMTSSGKNAEDVIEMCKILFGEKFIDSHAVVTGNINGNSPLVWDQTMLSALRVFSAHNQPVLCSPFVLGGANTPASVAPTVAQVNAEALSALAIHSGYPKRSTCDLWSLFSYCINAVWCSNGWNARNLSNEFYDWSNGKTL